MIARLTILALVALTFGLSACGKKGDPVRPGQEPAAEEEKTSPIAPLG